MKNRTLSKTYSAFINKLIERDMDCFTVHEAYGLLPHSSSEAVTMMLSEMVKKGWLLRFKQGLYHLIPLDRDPETFLPNWHLTASYLAQGKNYYIGYYSALELHSLITQPALMERVVVDKQMKPGALEIQGVKFQFIYHNQKHFFGHQKVKIDKYEKVNCSDLEKTIIDCLYKPEYAGGVVEIAKALYKSHQDIDYFKLLDYLRRFDNQAVIKRLGFLLEMYEINNPIIDRLLDLKSSSWTTLDPSMPKEGRTVNRWRIQINEDIDTLKDAPHT
ncbi:type IV toxin-antitoxin system AbiEi family antitoxin [Fulvivirgaceae bacterium BMA10]|uniref:Type IV toxin-antitoxin system AbiEi family antitoxin n=1 Tax=Splendidivirga corallicola TaxID=3051826 RepID=A0ABT8KLB6_9BACT|nr:type IV toxin-antitoxin system AbiEi family antitoxin [Fulvivirgaceae bacterium BMA10]